MKIQEYKSSIIPKSPATQPHRVVLHQTANGEWVTHMENLTENIGPGGYCSKPVPDYYWGHYFGKTEADYAEALQDYRQRCEKYNLLTNHVE